MSGINLHLPTASVQLVMSYTFILYSIFSMLFFKKSHPLPPASVSLFLSFSKSQSSALGGFKEHCVQLLLIPQTRKHLLLQNGKWRTQENHHSRIFFSRYNFQIHPASCPSSCYPTDPGCPSPQSSSGGAKARGAGPASCSLPISAHPNRIQPQLQPQQMEEPCSYRPLLPHQPLQGFFDQIPTSVLRSQTPTQI